MIRFRARHKTDKRSFRSILLGTLCAVSIVPLFFLSYFSYAHVSSVMQENMDSLINNNLSTISRNLDVELKAYEDVLFQLYTSDEVVELASAIDADEQTALHRNQLLRILRAASYYKPYIQGAVALLPNGSLVYYDKLSGTNTLQWDNHYPLTQKQILQQVSADNQTHYLPTAFTAHVNNKDHYVFYLAHRIINYRDIYQQCGVVLLGIDASMLMDTISYVSSDGMSGESLLLNENNIVLSSRQSGLQGSLLTEDDLSELMRDNAQLVCYRYVNPKSHWTVIRLLNMSAPRRGIVTSQIWFLSGILGTSVILLAAIFLFTRRMTSSIKSVVTAMDTAGHGDMQARITLPQSAPKEIDLIADNFNRMMGELGEMMDKVNRANDRQRQAEIAAVEAQINPHFLYNTLDTINWMAIDQEQYKISKSIGALGGILRYAIDCSNKPVTLREELGWLEKYVYLQQTRLKDGFTYTADADQLCLDWSIHKLLLQPFVENAIIHGFEGATEKCQLSLRASLEGDRLLIAIADNGKGMTQREVAACFDTAYGVDEKHGHIGVNNVLTRLSMYYRGRARVEINSAPGQGTTVRLWLPREVEERERLCES